MSESHTKSCQNIIYTLLLIPFSHPFEFSFERAQQHFRYLCHLASKDTIRPLVSARAPMNMVASLQQRIEHGGTAYGVCVCTPWTTRADDAASDGARSGSEEKEEEEKKKEEGATAAGDDGAADKAAAAAAEL